MVLVVPSVLAMLGDNPMQSEIACHVGLVGKFFCRVCQVSRGTSDDLDASAHASSGDLADNISMAGSEHSDTYSRAESEGESTSGHGHQGSGCSKATRHARNQRQ